jgi:hypothetical protein
MFKIKYTKTHKHVAFNNPSHNKLSMDGALFISCYIVSYLITIDFGQFNAFKKQIKPLSFLLSIFNDVDPHRKQIIN